MSEKKEKPGGSSALGKALVNLMIAAGNRIEVDEPLLQKPEPLKPVLPEELGPREKHKVN